MLINKMAEKENKPDEERPQTTTNLLAS